MYLAAFFLDGLDKETTKVVKGGCFSFGLSI